MSSFSCGQKFRKHVQVLSIAKPLPEALIAIQRLNL